MKAALRGLTLTLGLAIAFAANVPSARAQNASSGSAHEATIRAGYLTCRVASGWGFIFGSSRNLRCAYALQPGYTGIRPKISGPNEPAADFLIQGPRDHGVPGLVNLFGIESPGLTASLAIGEHVGALLKDA